MSNPRKKKYPVTRWRIAAGLFCFVLAFCIVLDSYLSQPDESPYREVTLVYCEDSGTSREYVISDATQVDLIEATVDAAVGRCSESGQPMGYPRMEVHFTTEEGTPGVFRIDIDGVMTVPNESGNYTVGKWESDTFTQLLRYLPESE